MTVFLFILVLHIVYINMMDLKKPLPFLLRERCWDRTVLRIISKVYYLFISIASLKKKLLGQPLTCNHLTEDSRKRVSYIVSYDMLLLMGMWMKESEFHVVCTSDKRIVERMDLFVLCDNVLCDMLNQIIANR